MGNLTLCEEKIPNRFKYTGQQIDPVTQQYYLRARFYNPVIARFTQEDTYRGDGLNLYAYCANNPKPPLPDVTDRSITQEQWQRAYHGERIIERASTDTGMSWDEIIKAANIGNVGDIDALAVYEHDSRRYVDVNPRARNLPYPRDKTVVNIIAIAPDGTPITLTPGGQSANTVGSLHAETGAMYQAYNDPLNQKGGTGTLKVWGKLCCTSCRQTNIQTMARGGLELDSLVVIQNNGTPLTFGGNNFFARKYGGVAWLEPWKM